MRANVLNELISKLEDVRELTIGEALALKNIFGLTNSEASAIFLGGGKS